MEIFLAVLVGTTDSFGGTFTEIGILLPRLSKSHGNLVWILVFQSGQQRENLRDLLRGRNAFYFSETLSFKSYPIQQ